MSINSIEFDIEDTNNSQLDAENKLLFPSTINNSKSSKWFHVSRVFFVVFISFIIILSLCLIDIWYHFKVLPVIQLHKGSLYLDKTDSTLQLSIIGKSDSLTIQNQKLNSQSYLNSYELQDITCVISYNKDNMLSIHEWYEIGSIDISLKDTLKKEKNSKDIEFQVILQNIMFQYLRNVGYLTYWYEPHAMKLECKTGTHIIIYY